MVGFTHIPLYCPYSQCLMLLCIIEYELQFLSLGELASSLPPIDDGGVAVSLPVPLPLGNEKVSYTTAYVSLLC